MASSFDHITPEQRALIEGAPLFFVASADPGLGPGPDGIGPVNVSPKGGVRLVVLDPRRVAYVDHRGSGNETARHAGAGGPVTVMVCSFGAGDAAIVRLFGKARPISLEDWRAAGEQELEPHSELGAPRQVIELAVERTLTSCGYGVPVMDLVRERRRADRGRVYKPG